MLPRGSEVVEAEAPLIMAATTKIAAARALFIVLDCIITATVAYTLATDGLPFRRELLTPWMTATLVDFYINVVAIAVWIAYKESNRISACIWIIMLICLGSITTCTYVVLQLFNISSEDSIQDPVYHVLRHYCVRSGSEKKMKCCSVIIGRIVFSILGCVMLATLIYTLLTDGSPFRRELLTPWLTATLIDFYINVVAIVVWVSYKESSWIGAFIWIILLICFGSITTCAYIVIQLFKLSPEDPFYLIFLAPENKQLGILGNSLSKTHTRTGTGSSYPLIQSSAMKERARKMERKIALGVYKRKDNF